MDNYKLISYKFDNNSSYIGILYEELEHSVKFMPLYDNIDGIFLPLSLTTANKRDIDYEVLDEIQSFESLLKEKYPEFLI